MDGKMITTITSNLTSPFNRKHRILFTARATKLLGLCFTGSACNEIDFACFCLRLAHWKGYFFSETGHQQLLSNAPYITLSDIYSYLPIDSISTHCWSNFIKALDEFHIDQDSQWGEVAHFFDTRKRNPLFDTMDDHPQDLHPHIITPCLSFKLDTIKNK